MKNPDQVLSTASWADELTHIGRRAALKAQEESRRLGVPNVYEINGITFYEWPDGELRRKDPYWEQPHREQPRSEAAPEG